jgi:hypothetical protein
LKLYARLTRLTFKACQPQPLEWVVNRIKEHLQDIPERELKLRVERPLIHNREIQHLLRGHPAVYDRLLVVRYMAGPLHAAVGFFASHLKDSIVDAGLITMGDRHKIIINPLPQMLAGRIPIPGKMSRNHRPGPKFLTPVSFSEMRQERK